jgi:hypothetical protein
MTERQEGSRLIRPSASPEEAGAIVAALERFRRATAAQAPSGAAAAPDEWSLAAILEGVSRQARGDARDPWINT